MELLQEKAANPLSGKIFTVIILL